MGFTWWCQGMETLSPLFDLYEGNPWIYNSDLIIGAMASQISSLAIVYPAICSRAGQRKHQSSASQAFLRGIRRWPVYSPHKWPVTRKMFPFDDVITRRWITITERHLAVVYTLYIGQTVKWPVIVEDFNFLGLTIDQHMTWNAHIQKISNKISRSLGVMNRLKRYLPQNISRTIYNSLILPHINHSILVWGFKSSRISKLQKKGCTYDIL